MMFQTFPEDHVSGIFTMQQTFTSRAVVELTGISLRQLQWWDEREMGLAEIESAFEMEERKLRLMHEAAAGAVQ